VLLKPFSKLNARAQVLAHALGSQAAQDKPQLQGSEATPEWHLGQRQ